MGYVTKVIGDDCTGYDLNVKSCPAQFIAIPLLQFDVYYCAHEFLAIRKIKRHNLVNLICYIDLEKISFPSDEFVSFLMSVHVLTMDSEKKRLVSRPLLSVFIMDSSWLIAQKTLELLNCDVSGPQSYDISTVMWSADFVEIYDETFIIGRRTESESVTTSLANIITPRTCYGMNLTLLFASPTADQVTQMLQSFVPSCQLIPFLYFVDRCHDSNGILTSQLDVFVKPPYRCETPIDSTPLWKHCWTCVFLLPLFLQRVI
jgi:hypothetical protein